MGYSFRLPARVLLYASSHRQDNTYHGLCYTSHGAQAGQKRNSSMGPPWRIDPTTHHVMSERSYHGATSHSYNIPLKTIRHTDKENPLMPLHVSNKQTSTVKNNITAQDRDYRMLKEGNVLFNDALNTFYLRLYGVRHMVKDHSDSERGNPLLPHGLLFPTGSWRPSHD